MSKILSIVILILAFAAAPALAVDPALPPAGEDSSVGAEVELNDNSSRLIKDCLDGTLNGKYSQREIRNATKNVPDDVAQYTACLEAIEDYQYGSLKKGEGSKKLNLTDDPITIADEEKRAIEKAKDAGGRPISLDGVPVVPGSAGDTALLSKNLLESMPWPLAVLLCLTVVGLLGSVGLVAYRRGYLSRVLKIFGR